MKKINKTDLKKAFPLRKVYDVSELLNDLGDYKYLLIRFANIYSDWRDEVAKKLKEIDSDHFSQERKASPHGENRMGRVITSKGNDKAIDVCHVYTRYYDTDDDSEHFILDSDIIEDIILDKELMEKTKEIVLVEMKDDFKYEWVEELENKYKVKFVGVK